MYTVRHYIEDCKSLISGYKEYLLSSNSDASTIDVKHLIQERDSIDNDSLIQEISRLIRIVNDITMNAMANEVYLDDDLPEFFEKIESSFNSKTQYENHF